MKNVMERPALLMSADKLPLAFCPGCQNPTVGRLIAEVLEEMKAGERTVGCLGIGCSSFIGFMLDVDLINGPHGRAPDLATGAKRMHPDNLVFTVQGDGDLLSIGAESLMGALARSEKITIIMINNTVYGTTGGQAAPTSLVGTNDRNDPPGEGCCKLRVSRPCRGDDRDLQRRCLFRTWSRQYLCQLHADQEIRQDRVRAAD